MPRGRVKTGVVYGYDRPTQPIILKKLLADCGWTQNEFAALVGVSKSTINLCCNKGYIPETVANYKDNIEKLLIKNSVVQFWLKAEKMQIANIWETDGEPLQKLKLANSFERRSQARKSLENREPAMVSGDPTKLTPSMEVEMIVPEAMKRFKIFRNPFIDDVQKDSDIFMSDEHRYIHDAMMMTAKHGGFLAVIGEVGSGKSVMRRKVIDDLRKDGGALIIFPQIIDKTRLTSGSICDAITMDISGETPKMRLEDKARQVRRLLLDRAKNGYQACLVIEEAHELTIPTLKYLKRFHELEDGYKKLLGIILIGQTELRETLDEGQNIDMREVIRRVQIAEIKGLNSGLSKYLEMKFQRVGRDVDAIFTEDAFEALNRRLTNTNDDNQKINNAYPLLINNYAARAMNLAWEMGEDKVTAEIIEAI